MTAILHLPQAKEDLLDIWCHIARDRPAGADHYLDLLQEKLQLLASTPGMGRPVTSLTEDLRVYPVDNYLIFFRQSASAIEIVRVLHGARDIQAIFRDDPI